MKPKEIIEKEKEGYIELSEDQIKKYIVRDLENGIVYFKYEYDYTFYLKLSCDYNIKETKKFFGLFTKKEYIFNGDRYYYNDDLKIFFNYHNFELDRIARQSIIINHIIQKLKNEIIEKEKLYKILNRK